MQRLPTQEPIRQKASKISILFRWAIWFLLGVFGLVVLACVVRWVLVRSAYKKLQAEVDRIVAAGEPIYPADVDTAPVPDEQNAVLTLKKAAETLILTDEQDQFFRERPSYYDFQDEHWEFLGVISEANTPSLSLLHKARSQDRADWEVRIRTPAISCRLPDLRGLRRLARTANAVSLYHHHKGNDDLSIRILRDIKDLATVVDQIPHEVAHLCGIGIDASTQYSLELVTSTLKVAVQTTALDSSAKPAGRSEIQQLIGELMVDDHWHQALITAMYVERITHLDSTLEVAAGRMGLEGAMGLEKKPTLGERLQLWCFTPSFLLAGLEVLKFDNELLDAIQEKTWPEVKNGLPDPDRFKGSTVPNYTFCKILTSSHERGIFLHFVTVLHRRMAAVALAIRLYELDHGKRPDALDQLVPAYLDHLPPDVFAEDGRSIAYLPDAELPILYSVGRNGEDDGGRYVFDENAHVDWEQLDIPFFLDGGRKMF